MMHGPINIRLILYVCNMVSRRGIAGRREWSNCPGQHSPRGS